MNRIKEKKRVVITGMGLVTSLGNDMDTTWENILIGNSGVSQIKKWGDFKEIRDRYNLPEKFPLIAGEIKDFDINKILRERKTDCPREDFKLIKQIDPFTEYACAASLEAVKDAGLKFPFISGNKVGVVIGSCHGGVQTWEQQYRRMMSGKKLSPFFIPRQLANLASGTVSILLGAHGMNLCPSAACASGAHSIGQAYRTIKMGYSDIVIAGGTEAAVTPLNVNGFHTLKALSIVNDKPKSASRPFDKNRDGFVMAEGAGILVLEDFKNARKRNAKIYAEIVGYAETGDAYHFTEPNVKGAISSMDLALKDARIFPDKVDLINAHATSTPRGDANEAKAIIGVFGRNNGRPMVTANKSQIGHALGAAGAIEAALTVLSVSNDIVPPILNLEQPSEECKELNYVCGQAKAVDINTAISNSSGFGGTNTCLVFKKIRA